VRLLLTSAACSRRAATASPRRHPGPPPQRAARPALRPRLTGLPPGGRLPGSAGSVSSPPARPGSQRRLGHDLAVPGVHIWATVLLCFCNGILLLSLPG